MSDDNEAVSDEELFASWAALSEAAAMVATRLGDGLSAASQLSLPEFDVLMRLSRAPDQKLTMTAIAEEIGLSVGGSVRLVDRMAIDGLVTRGGSRNDAERGYAALTRHGHELAAAALAHHTYDLRRHLLKPLGIVRLRELAATTRRLCDHDAAAASKTAAGEIG